MLQILSLRKLLEDLAPELTGRARTAGLPKGAVALHVREETVGLTWNGESVTIGEASNCPVELGQDVLMKLVLGLLPAEQVVRGSTEVVDTLNALFPAQPTATGVWG